MRNYLSFIFIAVLLVFTSCRKDEISPIDSTFVPDNPDVEVESSFFGLVKDQEGRVIEAARVFTEEGEQMTDENGYFSLQNGRLDYNGSVVKVTKRGYYDAFRFVMPSAGTSAYLEVVMIKRVSKGTVTASIGGPIIITDQSTLTFAANSIANEDGTTYSGDFEVFAHYYDPASANFVEEYPGDLRGERTSGEEVQLVSYGMIAVELVSTAGEPLNLLDGMSATWEIAVDSDITDLPEEMPLWSLDEQTGVWLEEGKAILENGKYVGHPTHFSFWNCDYPFPLVEISGVVADADETPIPNIGLWISTIDGLSAGYGITDSEGRFRGKVPKGEALRLTLRGVCLDPAGASTGETIYDIGPFAEDTDIGSVELNIEEFTSHFSGVFTDCSGMPIENGYVTVSVLGDTIAQRIIQVLPTGEMGEYSGVLIACKSGKYTFKGVDPNGLTESEELVFDLSQLGETIILDPLAACDELDEYFRYVIDGETFLDTDMRADLFSDYFSAGNSTASNVLFFHLDTLIPAQIAIQGGFECNIAFWTPGLNCDDMTVQLTTIPSLTENYCAGTITGTTVYGDGVSREVDVEFRLKVHTRNWRVHGNLWLDENENGIRDAGELPVTDALVTAKGFQVGTTSTGTYRANFEENTEPILNIDLSGKYRMTSKNEGSDDTLDSDFNSDGTIQLGAITEDVFNIDAGLIRIIDATDILVETTDAYCDEGLGGGCILVDLRESGVEYFVEMFDSNGTRFNSGTYLQELSFSECGLAVGDYEVVVSKDGVEAYRENFTIRENSITIEKAISLDCVGGEVEATMSVELIDNFGNSIIYPFGPLWTDALSIGNPLQSGPEYIAGPGTYNFTASYRNCSESVEFVVPDRLIGIAGLVWDDNSGAIPNEGEFLEPGIEGVEIVLTDFATGLEQSVTTDSRGVYTFPNGTVTSTEFSLKILTPIGYTLVEKGIGDSISTISSAADPLTGETDVFTLVNNCEQITNHFGLK